MEKGNVSGRGNMRSSRSPYLVIALLVLTAILAYKYWNLTTTNGQLSAALESLQIDFRTASDKHLVAEKQAGDLSTQLQEKNKKVVEMEAKVGEERQKFEESAKEVTSLKDQLQKAQESVDGAKKEVEQVRQEKDSLAGELDKANKQITDLQNAPKVCDKEACKEPLREVLTVLTKSIGKPPISNALKQNNVDLMSVAGDLLQGGDAGNQPVAAAVQEGKKTGQGKPNENPVQEAGGKMGEGEKKEKMAANL